ncbi:hypothetical protein A2U01_0074131, partial [Trifolium medium]|nr:hypothetical protein [Trifolium medium]
EAMKRHDEEEPQCYRVEVVEAIEDKCKVKPLSLPVERIVADSFDEQEAEWNREIEFFFQQLEDDLEETPKAVEKLLELKELPPNW